MTKHKNDVERIEMICPGCNSIFKPPATRRGEVEKRQYCLRCQDKLDRGQRLK